MTVTTDITKTGMCPTHASHILNDSSISGTTVKDALNNLSGMIASYTLQDAWNADPTRPYQVAYGDAAADDFRWGVAGDWAMVWKDVDDDTTIMSVSPARFEYNVNQLANVFQVSSVNWVDFLVLDLQSESFDLNAEGTISMTSNSALFEALSVGMTLRSTGADMVLETLGGTDISINSDGDLNLTAPAGSGSVVASAKNVLVTATSGVNITGQTKINTSSTTAFFVENDGVKDNTFIVDTTNGCVGFGLAPTTTSLITFADVPGTKANVLLFSRGISTRNIASEQSLSVTHSWSGAGTGTLTAIRCATWLITDSRTVNSGTSDLTVGFRLNATRSSSFATSTLTAPVIVGFDFVATDGGNYNTTSNIAASLEVIRASGTWSPVCNVGMAQTLTYDYYAVKSQLTTVAPTVSSGTLLMRYRPFSDLTFGTKTGTTLGASFYTKIDNWDTMYGYFNDTSQPNYMGGDSSKSYWGTNTNTLGSFTGATGDVFIEYTGTVWNFDIAVATTEIVFNNAGFDTDFRIEGDTDANLFYCDAGNGRVGIGTASPGVKFDVNGNATIRGSSAAVLILGSGAAGVDYQIKVDGETNDGLIDWMEDEDYFRFNDDIFLLNDEKLYLGNTNFRIYGSTSGDFLNIINDKSGGAIYITPDSGGLDIGNSTGTTIIRGSNIQLITSGTLELTSPTAVILTDSSAFYVADDLGPTTFFSVDTSAGSVSISTSSGSIGFYGQTPAARASAYTPSNVTTDRSYDANATTLDEVADVLGTLIADLQAYGLLQ